VNLVPDLARTRRQRLGLVAVELLLLLAAIDVELAGVRVLANLRRALVAFRLLDAQPREVRLDLGQPAGGGGFALARVGQPGRRGVDALRELA